ncbi:hypothetical protein L6164_016369 [Bauhinia variegata]|uniref:Uncharacterized protein n=1 Tax=Bauhinia variegata TaxID=167791 RepID=A0ACB9NPJ0_BAUVA|nr:hypothetical protein L6164_016369 [Bauhinia variegata]
MIVLSPHSCRFSRIVHGFVVVVTRSTLRGSDVEGKRTLYLGKAFFLSLGCSEEMASDPKVHTFEDVVTHNQTKDCWLIISGKVYNVTPFMDDHPGGDEVLLSATGKDATNDFEDVGHSDSAREMMEKYYIGEIDASTVPQKGTYIPHQQAHNNSDKSPDFVIKILQFLVPLLILALAFVVRNYTKKD